MVCVCVCVCVRERERERERDLLGTLGFGERRIMSVLTHTHTHTHSLSLSHTHTHTHRRTIVSFTTAMYNDKFSILSLPEDPSAMEDSGLKC